MKPSFRVIVQKYGGSSVASAEKIKQVAKFIKASLKEDLRLCVVVSAMGHTTNELIKLAQEVCEDPPKRELDMLTSCGERSSMALLAMALSDIGVKAISLTGSQSGIITDEKHSAAEIIAVKPHRVEEAFLSHEVVIIAGFQGISANKEITTLRRGGSDTTAVAMAAALLADVCEIYTDVEGVMDIDPKIAPFAKVIPVLSFLQMESMALYGAKVLAHDAILLAKASNISLRVAKTGEAHKGSSIIKELLPSISPSFSFSHLRALIRFTLDGEILAKLHNPSGYFLCGSLKNGKFIAYMSNDITQELIEVSPKDAEQALALITVHFQKNQMALGLFNKVNKIIKQHDFLVEDIIIGHNELFIIVLDSDLNKILATLYTSMSNWSFS